MYLDDDATRRVASLWRALAAEGVPTLSTLLSGRHRPHVSLAVARTFDPAAVTAALDGVTVGAELSISLDFVGQFVGRVLWLGVVPTAELLDHHRLVHDRLAAAGIDVWDLYRPGRWVPHCTVAMRVPNPLLAASIRRCLEVLPIPASVVRASLTDYANDIAVPLT